MIHTRDSIKTPELFKLVREIIMSKKDEKIKAYKDKLKSIKKLLKQRKENRRKIDKLKDKLNKIQL